MPIIIRNCNTKWRDNNKSRKIVLSVYFQVTFVAIPAPILVFLDFSLMADTLAFRIYFETMDDVGHIAVGTHRSVETRFPSASSIPPLSKSSLKRRDIE